MFIATRRQDWIPGIGSIRTAETLEEMESWIETYTEDDPDGHQMYVYQVHSTPVMKYTVIREIRGDVWDGASE